MNHEVLCTENINIAVEVNGPLKIDDKVDKLQHNNDIANNVERAYSAKDTKTIFIDYGFKEEWLCKKTGSMRIFSDANGQMNLSVQDVGGELLVVSQFTLYASTKKGNRPSFMRAARPEQAIPLYEKFVAMLSTETGIQVQTGEFGADMKVSLVNDGPVTIIMDSQAKE
jgi:D-tyrosyl-tRNA(Tyr) deacylase